MPDQFTPTDGEVLARLTQQTGDAAVALDLMQTDVRLVTSVRDDLRGEKIRILLDEVQQRRDSPPQ